MTTPGLDPDRLAALRQAKAAALVSRSFGTPGAEAVAFPGGGAVLGTGADGRVTAWVVRADRIAGCVGPAAALAVRRGASVLHVVADLSGPEPPSAAELGRLAHRLEVLGRSGRLATILSRLDGEALTTVAAQRSAPPPSPSPAALARAEALRAAGLEVVVEDGIVRGEVLGLEVARITDGPDGAVVEAGVGRFDREAGALLHAGRPEDSALAAVVEQVRSVRHPGGPPHAVNRLARERWLRAELLADPAIVGCRDLEAVAPARPRPNLRDPLPAPALGTGTDGASVLVVCATGVDLELVPDAAELVDRHRPDRVVLVVPPRDHLPALDALLALLPVPAVILARPGSWPT